jgi:hypothetical protein
MLKILFSIILGMLLISLSFMAFIFRGPDLSDYKQYETPQITRMFDQNMLIVEAQGSPTDVRSEVYNKLVDIFMSMDSPPEGLKIPSLRARWSLPFEAPSSEWVGSYAFPVPQKVEEIPDVEIPDRFQTKIETWEYGEVAQILHVGSYASEQESIEVLQQFISDQGYEIVGKREEEYLRGASFWPISRKDYTLIRYRVRESSN